MRLQQKISGLAMVAFLMLACNGNEKPAERVTLLEANPAAEHPEWKVSADTIHQDFVLRDENKKFDVPFHLDWVIAHDTTTNRFYIAYYKVERTGGLDTVKITQVRNNSDMLSCVFPDGEFPVETIHVFIDLSMVLPSKGMWVKTCFFDFNTHGDFLFCNEMKSERVKE